MIGVLWVKRVWEFQISGRSVLIMLVGVVLNYLLFFVTKQLNLPIWLDASGTAYAALTLGPVYGLVTGLIYNLILAGFYYGMNTFWYYSIVGVSLAIIIGICARARLIHNFLDACGVIFLCFLSNVLFFVLIALLFNHGSPDSYYGKMIFDLTNNAGFTNWVASVLSVLPTMLFDTVVSAVIVNLAYLLTPRDRYYY